MSAIPAITAIGALRAPQPSACVPQPETPPPITPLLKTKIKPQFDRTVTERSKPFFTVFQGSNHGQFQPCFPVFTVRSAEGRKVEGVGILANCQLPIASRLFSKIVQVTAFPHWKEIAKFTICSPNDQEQTSRVLS
jgi:hypothetical protein